MFEDIKEIKFKTLKDIAYYYEFSKGWEKELQFIARDIISEFNSYKKTGDTQHPSEDGIRIVYRQNGKKLVITKEVRDFVVWFFNLEE